MAGNAEKEKRRVQRKKLDILCPVDFEVRNLILHARMLDISPLGARFKIERPHPRFSMDAGTVMDYDVHTPVGLGIITAETRWSRSEPDGDVWGVEFKKISRDKSDPIHSLIDDM